MRLATLFLAVLLAPATLAQTDAPPADATAPADSSAAAEPIETVAPVVGQAQMSPRRDSDAETRALILNLLVPGLGHLNAGDTGTGAALVALGVGLPIGTALATGVSSFECSSRAGCDDLGDGAGLFLAAVGVSFGAWIYGMVDADNAVRRVQTRRLAAAPTVISGADGVRPGLALRVEL